MRLRASTGGVTTGPQVVLSITRDFVYFVTMPLEVARLCLGLLIAGFHAQIADFVLERENSLILTFRQFGVNLPKAIPRKTAHNLYFGIGIVVALVQLLRLHQLTQ